MSEENFFQPEQVNSQIKQIQETNKIKSTERLYGDIPSIPIFDAVQGIKYDFNSGLRLFFPQNENKYHLQFFDDDKNLLLYDSDVEPGTNLSSVKKYYIRYKFIITRQGTGEKVFEHVMDLKDKNVVVQFPVGTLGDSLGWFSYMERFQKMKLWKKLVMQL